MGLVYKKVLKFQKKYPGTVGWRLKKNSEVIERHLHSDETVLYAFAAQKNNNSFNIFSTNIVALTNKRILIGRKRVVYGYSLNSITPDLFNDLKVVGGLIWGKVYIDTVKEFVALSNIDKLALREIEEKITSFMMEEKKKYGQKDRDEED